MSHRERPLTIHPEVDEDAAAVLDLAAHLLTTKRLAPHDNSIVKASDRLGYSSAVGETGEHAAAHACVAAQQLFGPVVEPCEYRIEEWAGWQTHLRRPEAALLAAARALRVDARTLPSHHRSAAVVERSYLVRVVQRYAGHLPAAWESMEDTDRDQLVCDSWDLVDESLQQIDDDDLTTTVLEVGK